MGVRMTDPSNGEDRTPRPRAGDRRRRPAWPPIVLAVGLLVAVLLAGCIGGSPRPEPSAGADLTLTGEADCPADIVDNCDEVRADPDAPYVIEGLHLVKEPPENVQVRRVGPVSQRVEHEGHLDAPTPGIRIANLSRSLVVRDVEIEGYQTGLQIDNVTCTDCRIVVEDSRFVAGPCSAFGPDTSCRDMIEGYQPEGEITYFVLSSLAGYGIDAPGDADLTVRNTSLTGFVTAGIAMDGGTEDGRLRLRNVTVRCDGDESPSWGSGGVSAGTGSVIARRLQVSGCAVSAVGIEFDETVKISDSSMTRSGAGMVLIGSRDGKDGAYAEIVDTEIARNGFAGLVVKFNPVIEPDHRQAHIQDSTFAGNGWNVTEETREENVIYGALLFDGGETTPTDEGGNLTVRDSRFVGNRPYGTAGVRGTIDARWNWWNATTGPRVRPYGGPTLPPGPADAVNRNVLFTPHLLSPPGERQPTEPASGLLD